MQILKMTIKNHLSFNANRKKNKRKIGIIHYDEEKESNKKQCQNFNKEIDKNKKIFNQMIYLNIILIRKKIVRSIFINEDMIIL